jgi:hypothetical protein
MSKIKPTEEKCGISDKILRRIHSGNAYNHNSLTIITNFIKYRLRYIKEQFRRVRMQIVVY